MIEGMGPKHLNVDLFIRTCAMHNSIEAMFRQGAEECLRNGNFDVGMDLMIYISRGPPQCDQGLQLLDAYFGWTVPDHGEYTSVVDSARDLLKTFDVVHILTTNNITFQCEEARHFVQGAFVVGHEEEYEDTH
uniref:Uncharacterized protein n=1 Tax=Lactuca sativa TaxID=4236 RepID=A0A9R1XHF3_LACSA|nr:hypothetical protein LSAT_V11C400182260 [Lactuca sativa]